MTLQFLLVKAGWVLDISYGSIYLWRVSQLKAFRIYEYSKPQLFIAWNA